MNSRNRRMAEAVMLMTALLSGCKDTGTNPDPIVKSDPSLFIAPGFQPREGMSFTQNQSILCNAQVVDKNGVPVDTTDLIITWVIEGMFGSPKCDSIPTTNTSTGHELVAGAPPRPVGSALPTGEITVRLHVCRRSDPSICVDQVSKVTVKAPTGTITFTKVNGGRDFFTISDDFSTSPVQLTNSGTNKYWSMLSHDGKQLLYETRSGSCGSNLVSADPAGSNTKELTGAAAPGGCMGAATAEAPVFSPDDSRIAFVGAWANQPSYAASVMDRDGSNIRRLVLSSAMPYIAFHPNGREVVTGHENDGSREMVLMDVTSLSEKRIYLDIGPKIRPWIYGITPDGRWVITATPFTEKRIMLIATDGSGMTRWLTSTGSDEISAFSCFGGKSVCYVRRSDRRGVRAVDLDGTNDREVWRSDSDIETMRLAIPAPSP